MIPPCIENYEHFIKVIINTTKKYISRGYRKNYVPGWNDECETLCTPFKHSSNYKDAKKTLETLINQCYKRWVQLIEKTNFKHSNCKAWSFFHRLESRNEFKPSCPTINPNFIANYILELSRASLHKQFTKETKTKLTKLKREMAKRTTITALFTFFFFFCGKFQGEEIAYVLPPLNLLPFLH